MKRNLHLLLLICFCTCIHAQDFIYNEKSQDPPSRRNDLLEKNPRNVIFDTSSSINTQYNESAGNLKNRSNTDIKPTTIFDLPLRSWYNQLTGEITYYLAKDNRSSDGSSIESLEITYLDNNLQPTGKTTTVDFSHATNYAAIQGITTSSYFVLFIQNFPEGKRISETWLISHDNGAVIKKYPISIAAYVYKDLLIVQEKETMESEDVTINGYDINTLEKLISIELPPIEFVLGIGGPDIYTQEIGGKDYILVPYFEKIFETITPQGNVKYFVEDNFHIIDIYDMETLELTKKIKTPLNRLVDLSHFGEIEGEVGSGVIDITLNSFPATGWNFSTKKFNDDEKMEIIVEISYERFLAPTKKFINYTVINEDGEVIKKLEEDIVTAPESRKALNNMEGFDDMSIFTITDEDSNQYLMIFNVNKWEIEHKLPATYGDYKISVYTIRTKSNTGNNFDYLIATRSFINADDGNTYTYINRYDRDANLVKVTTLNLGPRANFYPIMSNSFGDPHIIDTDDALEFVYETDNVGVPGKTFNVTKEGEENPFIKIGYNETDGTLRSCGLYEGVWLFLRFDNNYHYYKLPLIDGNSIQNTAKDNSNNTFYSPTTKTLKIADGSICTIIVYNINGIVCLQKEASEIPVSHLQKGVYLVKALNKQGIATYDKVFIY